MAGHEILGLSQTVAVLALIVVTAALATPRGRLPLALRGLAKMMRRDAGTVGAPPPAAAVPRWKRLLAFFLVLVALLLAFWSASREPPAVHPSSAREVDDSMMSR